MWTISPYLPFVPSIASQFVNIPTQNNPTAYPTAMIIADIARPLGKFFSGSSVWSTNPPTTSIPPKANKANTINDNIDIELW